MKRIAIAITCGFALALIAALALTVIMQRQWDLIAQQDQQRIEAPARPSQGLYHELKCIAYGLCHHLGPV